MWKISSINRNAWFDLMKWGSGLGVLSETQLNFFDRLREINRFSNKSPWICMSILGAPARIKQGLFNKAETDGFLADSTSKPSQKLGPCQGDLKH